MITAEPISVTELNGLLNDSVPCVWGRRGECDREASWMLCGITTCGCNPELPMCTEHKDRQLSIWESNDMYCVKPCPGRVLDMKARPI